MERFENFHNENSEKPLLIKDPEEAHEFIQELYEHGERPVVTVPLQYAEALKKGLTKHTTWIPGLEVIAGTFGREPYLTSNESRIIVKVKAIDLNQIHPRFTGPQKAFQGIVILDGPINPDALEIVN